MVLDDLGPTGTLKLTNELNDRIHVQGGAGAGTYSSIETGLANTLATATKHTKSDWYRKWRTAMRHAGLAHYATDAQGLHLDKAVGYQSLVTLMQKGHGYAPAMVEDLTDDMIAAEKKHPGIWQVKGTYAGARGGWFANDPVDGMLGIMSRDPAGAARYLHSDAHMKYLMKDRDWNVTLNDEGFPRAGTMCRDWTGTIGLDSGRRCRRGRRGSIRRIRVGFGWGIGRRTMRCSSRRSRIWRTVGMIFRRRCGGRWPTCLSIMGMRCMRL